MDVELDIKKKLYFATLDCREAGGILMNTPRALIEEVDLEPLPAKAAHPNETAVYIADLLSELQIISKISGMNELSDDIEALLTKHIPLR